MFVCFFNFSCSRIYDLLREPITITFRLATHSSLHTGAVIHQKYWLFSFIIRDFVLQCCWDVNTLSIKIAGKSFIVYFLTYFPPVFFSFLYFCMLSQNWFSFVSSAELVIINSVEVMKGGLLQRESKRSFKVIKAHYTAFWFFNWIT